MNCKAILSQATRRRQKEPKEKGGKATTTNGFCYTIAAWFLFNVSEKMP